MAAPDRRLLLCPECGATNRAGETACFLCRHRLDTTWSESTTEVRDSSSTPKSTSLAKPGGTSDSFSFLRVISGITSFFLLVALGAICAGIWREEPKVVIVMLAVAITPALTYTGFVAMESRAKGRPMAVLQTVGTFIAAVVGVLVIAISALIAFCLTCIPVGFVTMNFGFDNYVIPLAIGGTAGVAMAVHMTYRLITKSRRNSDRIGKP